MANFSKSNKITTFCAAMFFVSLAIIYFLINLMSSHFFYRESIIHKSGLVLCEESRNILTNLKSDVEVFVLMERDDDHSKAFDFVSSQIRNLMNEYAQFCSPQRFEVEIIDVTENSKMYNELCARFGILPTKCVIITTNDKVKVISIDELYGAENGVMSSFKGESVVSSILKELSSDDKNVVYFIVGHGEYDINSVSLFDGLSSVKYALKQKNCEVRQLNLYNTKAIPDDADLVVIAGAKSQFLGFEKEILRDFIDNRDGKLLATIECGFDNGLIGFFSDYGISVKDDVITPSDDKATNYNGDLVLRRYVPHKINGKLIDFRVYVVFGATCEVAGATWLVDDEKFKISELIQADQSVIVKSKEQDGSLAANGVVATISERKKFDKTEITANAGKILVVGNTDFISNEKFKLLGNRMLFLGMTDYMLYGDVSYEGFDEIKIKNYRLNLSKSDYRKIYCKISILSISFLALALFVAFRRRK